MLDEKQRKNFYEGTFLRSLFKRLQGLLDQVCFDLCSFKFFRFADSFDAICFIQASYYLRQAGQEILHFSDCFAMYKHLCFIDDSLKYSRVQKSPSRVFHISIYSWFLSSIIIESETSAIASNISFFVP